METNIEFRIIRADGALRYIRSRARVITSAQGREVVMGTNQDVTEEHRLQQEQQERAQFTQTLLDNLLDGVTALDTDLNYLAFNQAAESFSGKKRADVIGKNILEAFPQVANNPLVITNLQRALRGEAIHYSSTSTVAPDRQFDYINIPLRHTDGTVSGVLTIARDVTEAIHLRLQIEERAQFTETLLDSLVDAVYAYDHNLNILSANKACERLYRKDRNEVIGKNILEVFPQVRGAQERVDRLRRALAGESQHFSVPSIIAEGKVLELFYFPLKRANGEVFGALSLARDVTEAHLLRRQLEARTQFAETLIESSVDLIAAYDKDLNYTVWNKKCVELLGIPREEVLGRHVFDIYPGVRSTGFMDALKAALQGESVHLPPRKSAVSDRHYETYIIPVREALDGEVSGVLTISHDMTPMVQSAIELEALNQSLEDKNLALERSVAELASFSYAASHDLQEPLRKIQAFAERILVTEVAALSSSGKDSFERIQAAVGRMQQLIDDLLTYSRASTAPGDFEYADLNELLDDTLYAIEEDIRDAQATIEVNASLRNARVIPFQFRQLLLNLLGNALKYRKPGVAPVITISSSTRKGRDLGLPDRQEDDFIEIAITDNGIGFEQQYAERIFGLFQRLHGRSQYSGTGLGLAICKKIVEKHQGIIRAEGRPGEGATFYVAIPL